LNKSTALEDEFWLDRRRSKAKTEERRKRATMAKAWKNLPAEAFGKLP